MVVAVWMMDASVQPNWTMPRVHELNAAGWYHAAFLIVAAGLLAWLWADFVQRLRNAFSNPSTVAEGRTVLSSGAVAIAWGSFIAYCFVAGIDSGAVRLTQAGQASLVSLCASLLVLGSSIIWAVGWRHFLSTVLSLAVAVPVAVALLTVTLFWSPSLVTLLFVIAAAAFGLAVALSPQRFHGAAGTATTVTGTSALELVAGACLYVTPAVVATHSSVDQPVSLLFLLSAVVGAVLWLLVVRRLRRGIWSFREDYPWIVTSAVFLVATSGATALSGSPDLSETATGLVFAILGAILAGPAIKVGKTELQKLTVIESSPEYRGNDSSPTVVQKPEIARIYWRLAVTGVGALCSIVALAFLTSYTLGWDNGSAGLPLSLGAVLGAIVTVLGGVVLFLIPDRGMQRSASDGWRAKATVSISLSCCLVLVVPILVQVLDGASFDLWAAIQSFLLALFAGECILSNGLRMGLVRPTLGSKVILVAVVASVFVAVYWSLTIAIGRPDAPVQVPQSLLGLAGAYMIVFTLTFGATISIYGKSEPKDWAWADRRKAAVQDSLMLLPMWLLMAWLPLTIYAHIPSQKNFLYGPAIVAQILVGFIALYVGVLVWITGVNNGHVGRTIAGMGLVVPSHLREDASHLSRLMALPLRLNDYRWDVQGRDDRDRRVRALSTHTAVQDALAFAIAAFTVLGFFWLLPADVEGAPARLDA
ncbi:hypothetical protein OUO20_05430 [Arthrobacter sp. FX8]|uniref:hypothetical protein n=1 Tax=Arthrobacter sp. FX8 TaxID=2997335 RepID=UPI00227B5720|nr:hypothetical protein [Arthrobacter sp. FX8]WAJ34377.1 hypothetical protein OUO20_05430 [Arthrobacter sp. FX8]